MIKDKFDLMSILGDLFIGLKSEDEIDIRAAEIIDIVVEVREISKQYLKTGIL